MQIQRECDRISAIDGIGRFLYLLLKIHLVRLGLQIVGAITIEALLTGVYGWYLLSIGSSLIIVDVALIIGPYLLLICAIALLHCKNNSV